MEKQLIDSAQKIADIISSYLQHIQEEVNTLGDGLEKALNSHLYADNSKKNE